MIHLKPSRVFYLGALALGGMSLGLGGCSLNVQPTPYRERVYAPPPPPPPVAENEAAPPPYEPAPQEAVSEYETTLNPYGHWVTISTYGRCWVPNDRPAGWQPYTVGHWESTDDGWCWVSEQNEVDWGPVCYHYGRWYQAPSYGWVWVPGTTWGPAWVAWRHGGEYCGWAPLPPQIVIAGGGVSVALIDRYIPRDRYFYCDERYICDPGIRNHRVRDVTIINRTTVINNNITIVNNRVVNRGVAVAEVSRYRGRAVETHHIAEAHSLAEARHLRESGQPVRYSTATIQRADTTYRQRVDARVAQERTARTSERERSNTRTSATEAQRRTASERANERSTAADQQRKTASERANERTSAADQQRKTASERANERNATAEQQRKTASERANQRSTAADQQRKTASERANERTSAADQQRKTASERSNQRSTANEQERKSASERANERSTQTPQSTEKERVQRREDEKKQNDQNSK